MINFINAFTCYEGTSLIPSALSSFIILPINFIVTFPDRTLYTLSKLTLTSSAFSLLTPSFMHITLSFQYEYSQKDLCHTLHTFYYAYEFIFAWCHTAPPTTLYIEDLFAYSLTPTEIYTSLLIFISSI